VDLNRDNKKYEKIVKQMVFGVKPHPLGTIWRYWSGCWRELSMALIMFGCKTACNNDPLSAIIGLQY